MDSSRGAASSWQIRRFLRPFPPFRVARRAVGRYHLRGFGRRAALPSRIQLRRARDRIASQLFAAGRRGSRACAFLALRTRHQFSLAIRAFKIEIGGTFAAEGAFQRADVGFAVTCQRPLTMHASDLHLKRQSGVSLLLCRRPAKLLRFARAKILTPMGIR